MNIPTWQQLTIVGQSRIVRSAYFWVAFTPIAAKVFSSLPNPIPLKFFGHGVTISFDLPFSWILFFWGALAFSLATFIFDLRCPDLTKNFKNYSDYTQSKGGILRIYRSLRSSQVSCKSSAGLACDLATSYEIATRESGIEELKVDESWREDGHVATTDYIHTHMLMNISKLNPNEATDLFDTALRSEAILHLSYRVLTSLMYLIGFALFGWVLYQNICFVFSTPTV